MTVIFTSNPSDYQKLEAMYVTERRPPGFIRGADISTVGFATRCVRGPTTPTLITSPGQFLETFGGRDYGLGGTLIGQGWAALQNKLFGPYVIRRVVASDAVVASFTWETLAGGGGTAVLRIDASSAGVWGNDVMFKIHAATDGNANHFNATIKYLGKEVLYENLDITTGNDNLALVIGTGASRYVTMTKLASGRPVNTASGVDGADTSLYVNLGETVAAFTSVAGAEGTLVVGDYTAGVTDLAVEPGVSVVLVPEAVAGSAATYHSTLVTLAAQVPDRIFLTWAQAHGQSVSSEIAQVAAQITTRSDRIVWCFNSAYTVDPDTDAEFQQAPHIWLASILSQTDIDVHAGSFDTIALLSGISRLTASSYSNDDLEALKAAGISTLTRVKSGFQYQSCVTTNLNPGLTELTRRRMADFLQLSAAERLQTYVKEKNTATRRAAMLAELTAFSEGLKRQERVVEDYGIDTTTVNTKNQRSQGEEHILWDVDLIDHILALVLETSIKTGAVTVRNA